MFRMDSATEISRAESTAPRWVPLPSAGAGAGQLLCAAAAHDGGFASPQQVKAKSERSVAHASEGQEWWMLSQAGSAGEEEPCRLRVTWSSSRANPTTVGAGRIIPSQRSQESMPVPCSLEHPAGTPWEKADHFVNEALPSLERPLFLCEAFH